MVISVSTAEQLDIDLVACIDPCDTYSTAFVLSDSPIEIKAFNDVNATITGEVEPPSGTIRQLHFLHDVAYLDLEEPGSYQISINASKEGYESTEKRMQIVVLDELLEITSEVVCNGDGECNSKETNQNCPQDCLPDEEGSEVTRRAEQIVPAGGNDQTNVQPASAVGVDWILVGILIVLLLMALAIWDSRRKK